MKAIFLLLVFAISTGQSQSVNSSVVIGTIDTIYSAVLKEKRAIWIYVPKIDTSSVYGQQNAYPVIYLLDAPTHFAFVTGMIQRLSQNAVCPEMIVVAIPNTDRTRDLTPTHISGGPNLDSNSTRTSGGGEAFTLFIEKELIPHIDSLYAPKPYRMLIGHSYGGLFVMNALIKHPGLFNSYVAIDPAMRWDGAKLLKEATNILQQKSFDNKTLFLAISNTMRPGMDTLHARKDTLASSSYIRPILQLNDLLKSNRDNGLRWSSKYYHEENHGTVPLLAEYDALHFVFSDYKAPGFANLRDSSFDYKDGVVRHYEKVSKQLGYTVLPPEPFVNELAYTFMGNKMFDQAKIFFEMNIKNYPNSFNVYDSMGDYYVAKKDKQKAIEYFSKALLLRDFPATREKMEQLKIKK